MALLELKSSLLSDAALSQSEECSTFSLQCLQEAVDVGLHLFGKSFPRRTVSISRRINQPTILLFLFVFALIVDVSARSRVASFSFLGWDRCRHCCIPYPYFVDRNQRRSSVPCNLQEEDWMDRVKGLDEVLANEKAADNKLGAGADKAVWIRRP